jgi:hypothetical protein
MMVQVQASPSRKGRHDEVAAVQAHPRAIGAKHLESARHHDSQAPVGLDRSEKIPTDVGHSDVYLELSVGSDPLNSLGFH